MNRKYLVWDFRCGQLTLHAFKGNRIHRGVKPKSQKLPLGQGGQKIATLQAYVSYYTLMGMGRKQVRSKLCVHLDRPLHAFGLCQRCYYRLYSAEPENRGKKLAYNRRYYREMQRKRVRLRGLSKKSLD